MGLAAAFRCCQAGIYTAVGLEYVAAMCAKKQMLHGLLYMQRVPAARHAAHAHKGQTMNVTSSSRQLHIHPIFTSTQNHFMPSLLIRLQQSLSRFGCCIVGKVRTP
jgi:hypothetical protein